MSSIFLYNIQYSIEKKFYEIMNIENFDLWCFDLDGTILQGSEEFYQQCFQNILMQYNLDVDAASYPRGMNLEQYLHLFHGHQFDEEKRAEIMKSYRNEQKNTPFSARLYKDAENFLKQYAGKRKVLVTNCSPITIEIVKKHIPLDDYFEAIFDRKPHILPKPNPDLYILAAESSGMAPQKCLVFEDSYTGIQAAKDANMHVIALNRRNDLSKNNAHHTILSFDELI